MFPLMNDLIIKSLLTGLGISIVSGPIGSLMVWQRMAYFGDTLAHATLLGVSLAALLHLNIYYGLIVTCILISVILTITRHKTCTNDTTLSILSNLILALGLIIASSLKHFRLDLLNYLYGDILSVTTTDLWWIAGMVLCVSSVLLIYWERLVLITLNPSISIAEGINYPKIRWIFIILISLVIAVSVRLVGVLLINSLLIIPCSLAKPWAKNPSHMAFLGSIYSGLTIILGIMWSLHWEIPTGPAIVVSNIFLLFINILLKYLLKFFNN